MTREERHIAVLNRLLENMDVYDSIQPTTERKKAIEAAIQALSQEPCDDAISRQAVLDGLKGCMCEDWVKTLFATMVKQLPSVTQKSETETWNGIHGQITAPKGTFKKIFEDAESEG